jgi:hypothetical protein
MINPRSWLLDLMHPYPFVKWLALQLPRVLQPKPQAYGLVVHLDSNGTITHAFDDASGTSIAAITSVTEHNNHLYLGGLERDFIGVVPLPTELPQQ